MGTVVVPKTTMITLHHDFNYLFLAASISSTILHWLVMQVQPGLGCYRLHSRVSVAYNAALSPMYTVTLCTCTAPNTETGTTASRDMGAGTAPEKQQLQNLLIEYADMV